MGFLFQYEIYNRLLGRKNKVYAHALETINEV